jgi:hypothetical protein
MLKWILFSTTLLFAQTNWEGFDYETAGLSSQEYLILQKSNIDEATFYELLKLGVKPSEYLAKPWLNLGIDEEKWWVEKKLGMSNEDMDQSWKKQYKGRQQAWISLLLPGYYQYSNYQVTKGILINSVNLTGLIGFSWLKFGLSDPNANVFLYLAASGNIYSFVHAWIQTKPKFEESSAEDYSLFHPILAPKQNPILSFRF